MFLYPNKINPHSTLPLVSSFKNQEKYGLCRLVKVSDDSIFIISAAAPTKHLSSASQAKLSKPEG